MKIGIIGFGQFGQFMSKHLKPFCELTVYDSVPRGREAAEIGVTLGSLARVASQDVVILAVPLSSFDELLPQIAGMLKPGALVLDVCSVKVKPIELMLRHLPETVEVIGTHPLFGPQSGKNGIRGMRVVLCPVRTNRAMKLRSVLNRTLELSVIETTAENHDREMAIVQGLTHFVARALNKSGIAKSELATVAFDHLLKVAELLGQDSWELFLTIQNGNPFAKEVRDSFIRHLECLEDEIK